jgi:predicted DNA-binding protein with PD1-like motif
MAFFTGRTGSFAIDGVRVAKIRDWSLETSVELLSTNTIESTSNTFVPGLKGATGSATLMYYRLEASDAGKKQFTDVLNRIHKQGAIEESDRASITLNVGAGNNDNISFNAYITSASISTSTGELAVVPINFTVDGEFTDTIAP